MNQLDQLLKKLQEGTCTAQELEQLDLLLRLAGDDAEPGSELYSYWKSCDVGPEGDAHRFGELLASIHHSINLKQEIKPLRSRIYSGFSKIAAILFIPLMLGLYFSWLMHRNDDPSMLTTVSVPLGARSMITLPDGSEVMLNSGSELTYPMSFRNQDHRLVSLNGEGYFKVQKEMGKPFVVRMKEMDLQVTGTSFNARSYNDESTLTVVLVEGSVSLGSISGDEKFESRNSLEPYDVYTFSKESNKVKVQHAGDLTKYIAWTQGRTVFDNDEIQLVIDKLEKLYNVDVIIQDKEILSYRLTATFTNEPLERALRILSLSSPISYQLIAGNNEDAGIFDKRTLILRKDTKKHN